MRFVSISVAARIARSRRSTRRPASSLSATRTIVVHDSDVTRAGILETSTMTTTLSAELRMRRRR